MKPLAFVVFLALNLRAGETAAEIMAKVAVNQDGANAERARYLFQQDVLTKFLRANGKLSRQEHRIYTVSPTPTGVDKHLDLLQGHAVYKKHEIDYSKKDQHIRDLDIDADLTDQITNSLVDEKNTKDGIGKDYFPLTSKQQASYEFQLEGVSSLHGRPVYKIAFHPKKGADACWAGEVLVDQAEYQPALVTTRLSFKMPLAVRTMLGTNVKQLGFQVAYQRLDSGVWFPVSYGTEFEVKLLFVYSRTITLSAKSFGFKRTDVSTSVTYDQAASETTP